ncbi:copper ion binding protein [Fictibacillus iocasae]|uniref:Copper ion binding protein n=1 Tax=Fictibacillus iocasae TaxID=2715437 RepID=A0ABW2NLZ4_9BACL
MEKKTLIVEGMTCNHCKMAVTKALEEIGVEKVNVSLEEKTVMAEYSNSAITADTLKEAIEDQGYDVKNVQ